MGKRIYISSLISRGITGVYKITNLTNQKIYIGSGFDIRERWGQHCRAAEKNLHPGLYFENALRKYTPEGFTWEVIEEVSISDLCRKTQRHLIRERLLAAEQQWLDSEQPFWWTGRGYNHNPNAFSCLGRKQTGKAAAGVKRKPNVGLVAKGVSRVGLDAAGARNKCAKWCRFTNPNGEVFTRPNVTQFCKSRKLNKGAMAAIARGKYISGGKISNFYKGWTAEYF